MMPLRYSRARNSAEKYVKLLHMKIHQKIFHECSSPMTWDSARVILEGMNWQQLRNEVVKDLDEESAPEMAFGSEELSLTMKDIKRVKTVSRLCLSAARAFGRSAFSSQCGIG